MRRFLQQLAASVMRPQPSLHPFAESIYPAPRASSPSAEGLQSVVSVPRPQASAAQPVPSVQSRYITIPTAPPVEAHAASERVSSAREDNVSSYEQQPYRPLLRVQDMQPSVDASGFASLRQSKKLDAREDQELSRGDHREEHIATTFDASSAPLIRNEGKAVQPITPLLPQLDAQALVAARRANAPSASLAPPLGRETRADDIQVHIGRIEVIAVPPAAPRPAPAPQRKGISLDDYLSRRGGRTG